MKFNSFKEYLESQYSAKNGTTSSYLRAIKILDELFLQRDVFNLNGYPLADIKDPVLISQITDYIVEEEDKYKQNISSIFDLGRPTQTSYPRRQFCKAAIRRLSDYVNLCCAESATLVMTDSKASGRTLSRRLIERYNINKDGTDKEVRARRRVGQEMFRAMLLCIYQSRCCLTGIDVPEVLRASHIIPWAEDKRERLNPENGLCLSATYDAAFDRHLISFDEEFRMILSPVIKEYYTSDAFKTYFRDFEGKTIEMPIKYLPSQTALASHRKKLIS